MSEDRVPRDERSSRPPPDVDRGPTRPLTERAARMAARAAMTDRGARFATRFEAVQRAERRRRRRDQLVERAVVGSLLLGAPLIGWWVASILGVAAGTGVGVGVPVGVAAVLLRRWSQRYATRRGAEAWDWQRRRHVVHGDPSRGVQRRSRPGAHGDGPTGGGRTR